MMLTNSVYSEIFQLYADRNRVNKLVLLIFYRALQVKLIPRL